MVKIKDNTTIETYNSIAHLYEKTYGGTDDDPYINKFLNYIVPGELILDAGCGPGGTARYIRNKGYKVEGIDLSFKMIEIARKKTSGVKFRVMDLEKLEYPPETFAGIVAAWSLIHVPGDRMVKVLSDFHRILKPGGYMLICAQKGKGEGYLREPLDQKLKAFVHFFTKQELTQDLKKAGFEVVYSVEKPPTVELDWEGTTGFFYFIAKKVGR